MGLLDELNKFVNQIASLKDKLTAKNAIIYDIITITMDRLTTVGTLIIYSVRYPKLKVLDMENNNMHSGTAGASSEEMPAWFMCWLNA
jgi:P2-related tail formation protein